MSALHDSDFHAWIEEQIKLLKERKFELLDIENLIEEVEDLGNETKAAVESHLVIALMHLIKKSQQPNFSTKSWDDSIVNARLQIRKYIERHPSLRSYPKKVFHECYEDARINAAREMDCDLRKIPKESPWTYDEVMGE